jgi:hypothetical protein
MKKLYLLLLAVIIILSAAFLSYTAEAAEWTNLYNDSAPGSQYPSFYSDWQEDLTGAFEYTHTITIGNDGSTNENFLDSIFVLNRVYIGFDFYTWNETEERFEAQYMSNPPEYLYLNYYDGVFDNSDNSVANLAQGIWPYFDLGNINAGEETIFSFISTGTYYFMEGDTLAHVTPVPEPATIFMFLSGLLSLVGLKLKK